MRPIPRQAIILRLLTIRTSIFTTSLWLTLCFRATGQTTATATIVGTVTDPSGSAIPNAVITATDTATGIMHNATSNETGQYVLPALQIGTYDLKVEAPGFKAETKNGIVLNVGDRARENFALQIGATQETITVSAAGIKLQT